MKEGYRKEDVNTMHYNYYAKILSINKINLHNLNITIIINRSLVGVFSTLSFYSIIVCPIYC